jgi:hypothetical protein
VSAALVLGCTRVPVDEQTRDSGTTTQDAGTAGSASHGEATEVAVDSGSGDASASETEEPACECTFTPPCERTTGCPVSTGTCPSVCIAWEQTLDETEANGRVRDLAMTPDGDIIAVGALEYVFPQPTEAFVASYTSGGRERWRVTPPVAEDTNVEAVSVATDSEGGAVVVYQIGWGVGEPRTAIFSLDDAGITRWVNDEPPRGSVELGGPIAMAADDSFFVAGSAGQSGWKYWIRHFTESGALIWENADDPTLGSASALGLTALADGGVLLLGSTMRQGGQVPLIGRLSPAGEAQWKVVDADDWDRHWHVGVEMADGSLLVFGNGANSGYGLRVARLTAEGDVLWRREPSGSEGCMGYAWSIASAWNRVFVLGSDEDAHQHRRVCLQEIDCDGHPIWQLTHSELGSDFAGGIAANEAFGLAISGGFRSSGAVPSHPWIARVDVDSSGGCRGE